MYTMILVLSKQKHGLSIVHINAHSPKNNMEEFRYTLENQIQTLYAFLRRGFSQNFRIHYLIYSDRGWRGGGVAVYVRYDFKSKIKLKSNIGDPLKFLFLELSHNSKYLKIGVV